MRRTTFEFAAISGGDAGSKEAEFSIAASGAANGAGAIEKPECENSGADRSPPVAIISGCAQACGALFAGT